MSFDLSAERGTAVITGSGAVAWMQHSQDGSLKEFAGDFSGPRLFSSQQELAALVSFGDLPRQQDVVVSLFLQQLVSEAAARWQQHGRFEQTGAKTTAIAISNRWRAPRCEIAFCDTTYSAAVGGFLRETCRAEPSFMTYFDRTPDWRNSSSCCFEIVSRLRHIAIVVRS